MSILLTRKLHHYETDSDGVCHFSNYLRIAEEGLFEAIDKSGLDALSQQALTIAVVSSKARYLNPLQFMDTFSVELANTAFRRTMATLTFMIKDQTLSKEICEIELSLVCLNKSDSTMTKLPQDFVDTIKSKV